MANVNSHRPEGERLAGSLDCPGWVLCGCGFALNYRGDAIDGANRVRGSGNAMPEHRDDHRLFNPVRIGNKPHLTYEPLVSLDIWFVPDRSEEHTSELQSHLNLVCRLLLEKKKNNDMSYSRGLVRRRVLVGQRWFC